MQLHIAKSAGFCFGVKRAMEMALKAAKRNSEQLHTLGTLIHNPQAVDHLKSLGIKVRNRIDKIPRGTVIFRSHPWPSSTPPRTPRGSSSRCK